MTHASFTKGPFGEKGGQWPHAPLDWTLLAIQLDEKYPILFISTKTFVAGAHLKRLTETLQMSTTAKVIIEIRKEIRIFLV